MQMRMDYTITKKAWLTNPKQRWNKGLMYAGNEWKAQNAQYPAGTSETYSRTGILGDKSDFDIIDEGVMMDLRSTFYWKYLMYGTGIWGPKAKLIEPVTPGVLALAWPNMGGGPYTAAGIADKDTIFAMSSKGSIWEGRLDAIIEALKKAFALGIRENADS